MTTTPDPADDFWRDRKPEDTNLNHRTTEQGSAPIGHPGTERAAREKRPTFDPEWIRDVSEAVYRLRLEQDAPGNIDRMIEKDEDQGERLRGRAAAYDPLTRAYLKVLGFEPAKASEVSDDR